MARIDDIIKHARYTLADPDKERYSDERLLFALSEGQKDIARQTRLLKGYVDIPLDVDKAEYDLPSDLWLIERALFDNKKLPLTSHARMDRADQGWFTRYGGDVEALVYDIRNMLRVRVFPRPDASFVNASYTFLPEHIMVDDSTELTPAQINTIRTLSASLVLLSQPTPFSLSPVYNAAQGIIDTAPMQDTALAMFGVVSDVEGANMSSPFGVISDINVPPSFDQWQGTSVFDGPFGVATAMQLVNGNLHIMYIKDPEPITSFDQELVVSPIFDTALRHYVIGLAFGDDLDTAYQQKSATALNMYDREIATVGTRTDQYDGTREYQYTGRYVGAFSE